MALVLLLLLVHMGVLGLLLVEGGVHQAPQQQQQQELVMQQVCVGGMWGLQGCSRNGCTAVLLLLLGAQVAAIPVAAAAGTRDQVVMVQQQNTVHMSMAGVIGLEVIGTAQGRQAIMMMRCMVAAAAGIGGRVGTEMTGVMTVMTDLVAGRRLDQRVSHQAVGVCSSRGIGKGEGLVRRRGNLAGVSSSSSTAGEGMNRSVAAVAATLLLLLAPLAAMRQVLLGTREQQQEVVVVAVMGHLGVALQVWVQVAPAVQQQAVLLQPLPLLLLLLTVNFALL
jgi:hypothetical protein